MDAQLGKVGQILFSRSLETVDPVLIEAFDILKKNDCEFNSLISLCTKTSWEISARISEAASVRFLGKGEWLKKIHPAYGEIKTPNAFLGIFLGIIKAANWYDNEWRIKTKFCDLLPDAIYGFIVCQSEAAATTANVLTSSYESLLSGLIKAYVRLEKEPWQKPDRLIHISRTLDRVRKEFDSKKLTSETLSPLGTLILDQILYALFGHVSVSGRMYAMAYLMNEHIDKIMNR